MIRIASIWATCRRMSSSCSHRLRRNRSRICATSSSSSRTAGCASRCSSFSPGGGGRLRAIQTLSAGVDWLIGKVPERIAVYNARGAYDAPLAEWVVGAILAMKRGLVESRRRGPRSATAPADDGTSRPTWGWDAPFLARSRRGRRPPASMSIGDPAEPVPGPLQSHQESDAVRRVLGQGPDSQSQRNRLREANTLA
jgi:hypothetical protein